MATKKNEDEEFKQLTLIAWVLVICALPTMLDSTMINIAINKLQSDLNTTLNMIQWAITGYVLALAVVVPFSGWMMDHLNGKKVLTVAVAAFGAFSLLSGMAWNIDSFIIFRIIQGLAGGVITMLSMSLLMQLAPANMLGRLVSIVSTPIILGPIIGPVIGGLLVQYANWHWIFFVNVPVVLVSVVLNLKFLPAFTPMNPKSSMDWFGTINLAAVAMSLLYGITKGSQNAKHFFNHQMVLFTGLGLALVVVYALYNAWRHDQTVMPLKFFKHRNFAAANLGVFLSGIAVNGALLLLPLYFQNTRGFTVAEAGLLMVPQGVGMMIVRPFIGRLIDRIGAKVVVLVSLAISLVGTVPLIWLGTDTNLVVVSLILFVRGLGIGGITMPMMTDIYIGFDRTEISGAAVTNRMIQYVGQSFGSAVMTTIITTVVTRYMNAHTQVIKHTVSQHIAHLMTVARTTGKTPDQATLALAAKAVAKSYTKVAMLHGYQVGFLISSVTLVLIVIPALFLTSKTKKAASPLN